MALLAPTLLAILLVMAVPRMGPAAALFLAAIAGLALILAGLAVSAHARPLMDLVLETTGKDLTLTGRTDLWDVAADLIAQRPLLGVGYQAFWVQGHADAEALWLMFGIEGRTGFNFHNMYISNAVEIGILGVLLQCAILFGAGLQTARWAIRSGEAVPALFFALTFMVILASVIEVQLFFQFSLRTVLVLAAFVYANEALRRGA
jgi:exopolysaccharide production protein ExoQ